MASQKRPELVLKVLCRRGISVQAKGAHHFSGEETFSAGPPRKVGAGGNWGKKKKKIPPFSPEDAEMLFKGEARLEKDRES